MKIWFQLQFFKILLRVARRKFQLQEIKIDDNLLNNNQQQELQQEEFEEMIKQMFQQNMEQINDNDNDNQNNLLKSN